MRPEEKRMWKKDYRAIQKAVTLLYSWGFISDEQDEEIREAIRDTNEDYKS